MNLGFDRTTLTSRKAPDKLRRLFEKGAFDTMKLVHHGFAQVYYVLHRCHICATKLQHSIHEGMKGNDLTLLEDEVREIDQAYHINANILKSYGRRRRHKNGL